MFLGMGPLELVIILAVVLVIFGPKNLPKLGKSLGQTVKNVREGMDDDKIEDGKGDKGDKDVAATEEPAVDVEDVTPEPVEKPTPAASAADVASDSDADAEESKFCPSCGAKNPASNGFCAKCGAKLQ